ncbi:MAG: DUF6962 family protein [Gemmatimonadota bacterium]
MGWNPVITELTTGATDAILAVLSIAALAIIRGRRSVDRWKIDLWSWLLALLAAASVLGAAAHGLNLSEGFRDLLWKPLYLCLGLVVALFVVAAIRDRFGERVARRVLPWMIVIGFGFFAYTEVSPGTFLVFVAYEACAMLITFVLYMDAAIRPRVPGAKLMTVGVALNILAAGVQQSSATLDLAGIPLDHNGVFHLVQMVAVAVLTAGVLRGLNPVPAPRRL